MNSGIALLKLLTNCVNHNKILFSEPVYSGSRSLIPI